MAKILVVDDQSTNRQYLVDLLSHFGHDMIEAGDGLEGLERARAERPELVIADILMPEMDGYEFVRCLRLDPSIAETPVVFHSAAYCGKEVLPLAQACGVAHVLFKPAEPEQILSTVGEALGIAQTPPSPLLLLDEFDREHLDLLTNKLAQKASELEVVNERLAALVDLGLELGRELDRHTLLVKGTLAARTILGASCTAVGIYDKASSDFSDFVTSGIETETAARFRSTAFDVCLRCPVGPEHRAHHSQALRFDHEGNGNGTGQPSHTSFLCSPIASSEYVYGHLYVANKQLADGFSANDERLCGTIATQLAIVCENAKRHEDILRQASELRQEVAERKRVEAQIRTLNTELEERVEERTAELSRSNADLEQFAYVAAHDLQEPLRKVVAYSQMLARNYVGKLDKDADEFIAYAVDGALRMQSLIQDLLAYSRVGKTGHEMALVSGVSVLQQALSSLEIARSESRALVTHDPLPDVMAVERQLVQVLQNLIGNALKFHGAEPPRVHVSAQRHGEEWIFSVRDNGLGIDPQFTDRIFIIFQRLHTRSEFPGTGIGLAICKKIVEQHGGRIWVDSQPGAGATFFFTLPA